MKVTVDKKYSYYAKGVKIQIGRAAYRITEQNGHLRILADRDLDGEFSVFPCSANEVELRIEFPQYEDAE